MVSILLALSLAALGDGSITTAASENSAKPEKTFKERLVCRTQQRLGSRLGAKRVCNTKARWAEIETDSGAAVRDAQRNMSGLPTNGT